MGDGTIGELGRVRLKRFVNGRHLWSSTLSMYITYVSSCAMSKITNRSAVLYFTSEFSGVVAIEPSSRSIKFSCI